jgi:hypothetical protein
MTIRLSSGQAVGIKRPADRLLLKPSRTRQDSSLLPTRHAQLLFCPLKAEIQYRALTPARIPERKSPVERRCLCGATCCKPGSQLSVIQVREASQRRDVSPATRRSNHRRSLCPRVSRRSAVNRKSFTYSKQECVHAGCTQKKPASREAGRVASRAGLAAGPHLSYGNSPPKSYGNWNPSNSMWETAPSLSPWQPMQTDP